MKFITSHLKNKNTWIKGIFILIEIAIFYGLVKVFLNGGYHYVEQHHTEHTLEFFNKMTADLSSSEGTNYIVFWANMITAVMVIPFLYFIVWVRRIYKWITKMQAEVDIRSGKKVYQ